LEALSNKQLYHVLELPKHLQVTILALIRKGSCTASQMAQITGKARAVESSYLNQLITLKFVKKEREAKFEHGCGHPKIIFSVDLEALNW
jgi:hypothetical protein